MSYANKPQNDSLLTIRMPEQLLNQLNALAQSKAIGTSSMARMVLAQYLTDEAPKALIGISTPLKPQGKVLTAWEKQEQAKRQAMSPAQRKAYDEEWADDDWA
jgi:hypothetical protein